MKCLSIILCLLCASVLMADAFEPEKTQQSWTFTLYWENDIFAGTDSNYTNGNKFTWISPDLTHYRDAEILPEWLYDATEYLPFIHQSGLQRNVALSLGQSMFTPRNIAEYRFLENQRPYAGWLYMGVALHNKNEHFLDTMEINVGVVGSWSLAEDTQIFVHEVKGVQRPNGWAHQIKNEPAFNLVWERKFRLLKWGDAHGLGMDFIGHTGAALGNVYTYANGGGEWRLGWNLPSDFGTGTIRLAGDTNAPASVDDVRFDENTHWGVHGFVGVDGRAMARDIFLDGNSFRDSHRVHKKTFVGDFYLGVSLIAGSWKTTFTHMVRSREFDRQHRAYHQFGSLSISYSY